VVKVTVRCFASVRELLGSEVLELEVPDGSTIEQVVALLASDAPDLGRLPFTHAVNQSWAEPGQALADGDELALIPPISGGAPEDSRCRFDLERRPLDPRALEREARTDRDGAVVTFAGVTRDHHEGRTVRGLSYEAYEEMARTVMDRLFARVVERHELGRIRVAHRLGDVPIGEASVVVVVAAAHRAPAFDAARELMDALKREVPIFKKEWLAGPEGESRWVGELPRPEE
jgi:molybdopterin synthase catalytic subunit/molybdopterin converting factor small subunit